MEWGALYLSLCNEIGFNLLLLDVRLTLDRLCNLSLPLGAVNFIWVGVGGVASEGSGIRGEWHQRGVASEGSGKDNLLFTISNESSINFFQSMGYLY